jgi:LEA14-like dessication related protein
MNRRMLAAAAALSLCGCSLLQDVLGGGFQRPTLTFETWSADQLDLDGVTIALHYRIENPNGVGLDLQKLGYRLDVEGKQVVQGELPGGLHVRAQGATPLAIPVRLRWGELPGFLELLFTRSEVAYRVSGHVGVGSPIGTIDMPFEHRDRVALPRPPSLALEGVSVRETTLTNVAVDVKLRIENRNAFPLPVGALAYGLRVGQRNLVDGSHPLVAVPAGGNAVVSIPIRVSVLDAAEGVQDLLRGAEIRLRGLAGFGALQVPVDTSGRVR